jgi:hypothetical protein
VAAHALPTEAAINAKLLTLHPEAVAMIRYAVVAGLLTVMLPCAPSLALTPKQKMETCKFGADDQKLQGTARKSFMAKCMANRNDPRGPAGSAKPGGVPPPQN